MTIENHCKSAVRRMAMLLVAIVMAVPAFKASAVGIDDLPEVKMYYPSAVEDTPMELKPTAKAYVYFVNGSKVTEVKALIMQEGKKLGTCTYTAAATGATTVTMDPKSDANTAMSTIVPGEFTLVFYETTFYLDGNPATYSDETAPFGSVTYFRNTSNGKVVKEEGLADLLVKSYFTADGTDGVKTFYFSKPIDKTAPKAVFAYGYNNSTYTDLPCEVADDGMSLTVDMRGKCYNVDVLAPGVHFVDDFGNPIDPPAQITLQVTNLKCLDGTKIEYEAHQLGSTHSVLVEGAIYETFNYQDITQPTPVIKNVEFYNSTDKKSLYPSISANTDMMVITLENTSALVSCNITIERGTAKSAIADADVAKADNKWHIAIPASIKDAPGTITVGMRDLVYDVADGAPHTVKPFVVDNSTKEVDNIKALKALDTDTKLVLNMKDTKVTMSNEWGYCFIQDATAAIQLIGSDDLSKEIAEGTSLSGLLAGTYLGNGLFSVDLANSDFTAVAISVADGESVTTGDIIGGLYDSCLVTIGLKQEIEAVNDPDMGAIIVDEILPVVTNFVEEDKIPDNITNITGIVYFSPDLRQYMLIVRSEADFNHDQSGIKDVLTEKPADGAVYDLRGVRVDGKPAPGIYIVSGKKTVIK